AELSSPANSTEKTDIRFGKVNIHPDDTRLTIYDPYDPSLALVDITLPHNYFFNKSKSSPTEVTANILGDKIVITGIEIESNEGNKSPFKMEHAIIVSAQGLPGFSEFSALV